MKTCSIDGCENGVLARGWCNRHYKRWQKFGDPLGSAPPPEKKTCSIDGCEKPHEARGWCNMHYQRWQKHGDPLATLAYRDDPEAAFLARTEPIVGDPGCIIWTGGTVSGGYGSHRVDGRMVLAHRYAWEREHGPIPDGMFIDHTCWERSCVNPDHLRLATISQNSANRSGAQGGRMHDLPRGVYRSGRRYAARVRHNGTLHNLGTFSTPEEASAAAQAKRAILFGEYAGGA